MDDGDAYWGAKIVTAFTDETIEKLAASGEYSRQEVARYIAEALKRRRDAIGRYYLDRITPLEDLTIDQSSSTHRVKFRDLALERGDAGARRRAYRFWIEDLTGRKIVTPRIGTDTVEFPRLRIPGPTLPPDRFGRTPIYRLFIQSNREGEKWASSLEVILGFRTNHTELEILGWTHAAD